MAEPCPICDDAGMRVIKENDRQVAVPCVCRIEQRNARLLERARIPKRYEHCAVENFETDFSGSNRTIIAAHLRSKGFIEGYPIDTSDTGLLFSGSIGVGKTHLAVGILKSLILEKGAVGLFYDYRDLLKQIQNTYSRSNALTEQAILRPVFDAEVLVLDEVGAAKVTDWVWDTVAHVLNTRYNDRRTTIITSNYANLPPLTASGGLGKSEETLGDRIGERMRSRLQEMCVVVEMQGVDFRQNIRRASFTGKSTNSDLHLADRGVVPSASTPEFQVESRISSRLHTPLGPEHQPNQRHSNHRHSDSSQHGNLPFWPHRRGGHQKQTSMIPRPRLRWLPPHSRCRIGCQLHRRAPGKKENAHKTWLSLSSPPRRLTIHPRKQKTPDEVVRNREKSQIALPLARHPPSHLESAL